MGPNSESRIAAVRAQQEQRIDEPRLATAVEQAGAKSPPARLHDVRLETLSEGCCVQTMHVGAFDDEADVLARMHHDFIPGKGLRMVGKHHEIYLSDLRRSSPRSSARSSGNR